MPFHRQIGRRIAEVAPGLWPQVKTVLHHVLQTGTPQALDMAISGGFAPGPEHEAGQMRHWTASYHPVAVDENVIGVGIVAVDITEHKIADHALRAAEEHFRCLADQSMIGIYIIQDGKFRLRQ